MKITRSYALILGSALMLAGGTAAAAIVDSKHDLGSATLSGGNKVAQTDETCVFCHTPHAASTTTLPLWNKQLTAAPATVYSSTTIDGTTNFTGSTSMACLSCHDGTQAMDNIVNASGSGVYDATGGGATGLSYTWTSPASTANADGTLVATALANLSTNLGDDHPVAIQYGGGGITAAATTAPTNDPDFGQVGVVRAGQPLLSTALVGGVQKWWFEDGVTAGMQSDEVRLYTRSITAGVDEPFVECASCHDPHKGENATFLRVANTSSAVCTACHSK